MADQKSQEEKGSDEIKKQVKNVSNSFSRNPWAVATIVLAILLVLMYFNPINSSSKGIGKEAAGLAVLNFIESRGGQAEITEINEQPDLYEVVLTIDDQILPVYLTKDGQNLAPNLIPLSAPAVAPTTTTQPPAASAYSAEDLVELKTFNDCLGTKGVKVYGANWCGWTKKWVVETLGGFDTASAIYIECTEEQATCDSEGVQGYPTTKINGVVYSGDRTIQAIAQETGCPAPTLSGTGVAPSTTPDASC